MRLECSLSPILILIILSLWLPATQARTDSGPLERRTRITDFRYSTARIDGIARLFNDSLIVISNGYYWVLDKAQTPNYFNVRGSVRQLYHGFSHADAIWVDPYNDISPQIYLAQITRKHGLRVVCQEFYEQFSNNSSFCHLPVSNNWKTALKDLDFTRPLNAVTWRNRTKDKEGGFWVFFQDNKMVTIDPYEMHLRYTYDIKKWMSINESITAAYYDYHRSEYHFFFDNNKYRKWTVNVTYMNRLPMSWDRAFLHGTLSPPMKINRHFFGFDEGEVRDWPQPHYERIQPMDRGTEEKVNRINTATPRWSITPRPSTTSWHSANSLKPSSARTSTSSAPPATSTVSDVEYLTPRTKTNIFHDKSAKMKEIEGNELEPKDVMVDTSEASYQKQLMQLHKDGVLDFSEKHHVNDAHTLITSLACCNVVGVCATLVLWGVVL